jgi:murein DD-endopeptidase MepM/ murein hydrolase activator NlpD
MKHVVAALVLTISVGILLERLPEPTVARVGIPFRVLQLRLREPDNSLLMPVAGVPVKRVANTWHAPRSGGRRHVGQDIFAKRGTPVISATDGVVVRVGTNSLGGKIVSVMGKGGRVYYYAHLDRYAEGLAAGDEVVAGDTLGYVGNTGNARTTPPHLHFGVYTATGAVDPLPLLIGDQPTVTQKTARS